MNFTQTLEHMARGYLANEKYNPQIKNILKHTVLEEQPLFEVRDILRIIKSINNTKIKQEEA